MTPQEIQELVSDIRSDLASVTWSETTASTSQLFEKSVGARTFSGTGNRWSHNLMVWVEQGKARCEGSAVMLTRPVVVRYTPELAQRVLKLLEEGGFSG